MESSPHRNSYIGGVHYDVLCQPCLSFPQKQEQPAGRENTSPSLSASPLSSYRYRPNLATLVLSTPLLTQLCISSIPWASFSQMHLVKSSWMTSWKLSKRRCFLAIFTCSNKTSHNQYLPCMISFFAWSFRMIANICGKKNPRLWSRCLFIFPTRRMRPFNSHILLSGGCLPKLQRTFKRNWTTTSRSSTTTICRATTAAATSNFMDRVSGSCCRCCYQKALRNVCKGSIESLEVVKAFYLNHGVAVTKRPLLIIT